MNPTTIAEACASGDVINWPTALVSIVSIIAFAFVVWAIFR